MLGRTWILFKSKKFKKNCKIVVSKYKTKLPITLDELKKLPGIGEYTASAILAIAFNKPYIPMDGNIERVIKRLLLRVKPIPHAAQPE